MSIIKELIKLIQEVGNRNPVEQGQVQNQTPRDMLDDTTINFNIHSTADTGKPGFFPLHQPFAVYEPEPVLDAVDTFDSSWIFKNIVADACSHLLLSFPFQKCNLLGIVIFLCYNSNILIIEVYGDRQNLSKFFTGKKEVYHFAGGTVMEDEIKKLYASRKI